MPRIKGICGRCRRTILLGFDEESSDFVEISKLEQGEFFELDCPACYKRAVFEKVTPKKTDE